MNKVRIAILGMGNVGTGVWKILNSNKEQIVKRSGAEIEVVKVLVRDPHKKRNVNIDPQIITTDINEILNDDSISIVVELMGGINPAKEYILRSIKKKKNIVTANKLLIATEGDEIFKAAMENKVILNYEASVAGGIPIIHGIKESLTANRILQVVGIINGTTNYILTKMTQSGMSFNNALKEAQEKGFAEADPTSDVDGYDAVYKLAILSSLAFDTKIDANSIYREGIRNIDPVDIKYAKEFGYTIKLLAIVKDIDGELEMRVHPTMIPLFHPLANVNNSFNAIFVKGNAVGDLMLYGRGAGDLPTGSAVVSDIISIIRNDKNPVHFNNEANNSWSKKARDIEKVESKYYIRLTVDDTPGVLGEISTIFGRNDVSLRTVIQKGENNNRVPLVFVTHECIEGNLNKSMDMIRKLQSVIKVQNIIRVEDF